MLLQSHEQQSHAHIHAVLGLAEVCSPRIQVKLAAYLVDTWQWMHDDHLVIS